MLRFFWVMIFLEFGFFFVVRIGYIYYCLILKIFYEYMKIIRIYDFL